MSIELDHLRTIEAAIFASAEPIPEAALARFLPVDTNVAEILDALRQDYSARGVNLVKRGSGWAFRTAPDLADLLAGGAKEQRKLSRAALETLAIITYHQPATRAEIEAIRGVRLGKGTLDTLFEAGWVRPHGRKPVPGRPVLWETTPAFLDHFGLGTLDELPGLEELRATGMLDTSPSTVLYGVSAPMDPEEAAGALPEDDLFGRLGTGPEDATPGAE